ncbi:MAG: Rne/Rng family ribonuclease [Betaproteobacteria bacterium]|jgi:ribonuclease E|nr:Rne/Rng family ribonuclease [Betaproteobacteria bacterium]
MKRMLFNATQAEELRVAIVEGQKLIDLDIESASKEQRKGNIYKGIITRVEPSLEAAFVDYGAERHGFLPFKEISRSYFRSNVDPGRARIQDAVADGTEVLVQVEKDERGTKGAALTTFISLAGRYLVLMPNNPRGGGVSRRIEGEDRNELREAMDQLTVPQGMSIIGRTAGIGRNFEELAWDLTYLLKLWEKIVEAAEQHRWTEAEVEEASRRGATLRVGDRANPAPFLIYQESSLVIRAIRDYFQPDIGEILIDTDSIYEQTVAFMGNVMPDNVQRVKRYHDDVPLFSRFQIEHQIETAYSRQVPLPSGGAIVIDHTEALVSIDVNSARATKGADIEETALRTNVEASDEIARQLRLRDLGGLIVIDFIDMESQRGQREVENRLRDALRPDRARVQMGKISRFGLMELSRQRLRPSLGETSHQACPRCNGTGHVRSIESSALHILRIMQEEAMKENSAAVHVQVPVDVATYLLNEKRDDIHALEARLKVNIVMLPNIHLETPNYRIERLRHDDLNQEGVLPPSYRMVEAPAEEEKKLLTPDAKPARAEAVVKGVTPEQPAPMATQPAPAPVTAPPAASVGIIDRIFSWFRRPAEVQAPATRPTRPAPAEPRREHRERRDRHQRRDRQEGRPQGGRSGERSQRDRGDRGERGERGERRDRPQQGDQRRRDQRADQGERSPRDQRRDERPRRPDQQATQEPRTQQPALASPQPGATEGARAEGERRGGRRRRRGRGGDRGERSAPQQAVQAERIDTEITETVAGTANVLTSEAIPVPEMPQAAPITESTAPEAEFQSAPAEEAQPAVESVPQPAESITPTPTEAAYAPGEPERVVPTPPPSEAPAFAEKAEPVPEAAPSTPSIERAMKRESVPTAPVEARAPQPSLDEVLQQSGLVLVETSPAKAQSVEAVAEDEPVAPRPPRERRPPPPEIDQPLQQVETRKEEDQQSV